MRTTPRKFRTPSIWQGYEKFVGEETLAKFFAAVLPSQMNRRPRMPLFPRKISATPGGANSSAGSAAMRDAHIRASLGSQWRLGKSAPNSKESEMSDQSDLQKYVGVLHKSIDSIMKAPEDERPELLKTTLSQFSEAMGESLAKDVDAAYQEGVNNGPNTPGVGLIAGFGLLLHQAEIMIQAHVAENGVAPEEADAMQAWVQDGLSILGHMLANRGVPVESGEAGSDDPDLNAPVDDGAAAADPATQSTPTEQVGDSATTADTPDATTDATTDEPGADMTAIEAIYMVAQAIANQAEAVDPQGYSAVVDNAKQIATACEQIVQSGDESKIDQISSAAQAIIEATSSGSDDVCTSMNQLAQAIIEEVQAATAGAPGAPDTGDAASESADANTAPTEAPDPKKKPVAKAAESEMTKIDNATSAALAKMASDLEALRKDAEQLRVDNDALKKALSTTPAQPRAFVTSKVSDATGELAKDADKAKPTSFTDMIKAVHADGGVPLEKFS